MAWPRGRGPAGREGGREGGLRGRAPAREAWVGRTRIGPIVRFLWRAGGTMRERAAAVPRRGTKSLLTAARAAPGVALITWPPAGLFKAGLEALSAPLALVSALAGAGEPSGGRDEGEGKAGRGGVMPRSFLVDSLVLREGGGGEKKGGSSPGSPPPPPPPPLFPYAVHPSHPLHGLSAASGGACPAAPGATSAARKAGLLCVCPLCVAAASQLHPPPPPALPLLKASFPPFGSQYCPSPLAARQSSGGAAAAHPPALYQSAYPLPDPRHFHCISVGESPRGGGGRQPGKGDESRGWEHPGASAPVLERGRGRELMSEGGGERGDWARGGPWGCWCVVLVWCALGTGRLVDHSGQTQYPSARPQPEFSPIICMAASLGGAKNQPATPALPKRSGAHSGGCDPAPPSDFARSLIDSCLLSSPSCEGIVLQAPRSRAAVL